jgi:hypothetical protein
MKIAPAVLFSACALAQAPTQQMVDTSLRVLGAVQQNGKLQPVSRSGGFFLDARHVVTMDSCCGKTQEGQEKIAVVVQGEKGSLGQPVWSGAGGVVILELKDALQAPPITLAPLRLTMQNQPVFTVVFPDQGAPSVSAAKVQGVFKPDGMDVQVYRAAPPPDDLLAGGAMFNACGQVLGINVLSDKGIEFALVADALAPGLEKAGARVQVADQQCGGAQSDSTSPPQPQTKPQSPPRPKPDGGKGGDPGDDGPRWRLPQGGEWVGVAMIAGLIGLAMRRNTRETVARALTTRRSAVPQPAYIPPRPQRPVLKGIAGQYAGSSIALDTGESLLGRDQSVANLVFGPESDSISKRHCRVGWDAIGGVFRLEDLGSTNGTFLANGERLAPGQPRALRPGDRFYIGDLRNQFEVRMEG